MSESLRDRGAYFLLAMVTAMLAPGCAANESTLFIRQCQVWPQDSCEVTNDPEGPVNPHGALDVAFAGSYACPLLFGNQLVSRGDPDRLRTETSRVVIDRADVTVRTAAGGSLSQFSVPTSGFADPSAEAEPGYGLAWVEMIPASLAPGLPEEVVAEVVLYGRSLGGTALKTAPWRFPIHVCSGCLCDPTTCGQSGTPPENCHPGVDAQVDCRALGPGGMCP